MERTATSRTSKTGVAHFPFCQHPAGATRVAWATWAGQAGGPLLGRGRAVPLVGEGALPVGGQPACELGKFTPLARSNPDKY